ncbi:MAG: lactonase family protein [Gemmatimonadetes bacterium]|nr:lactonase family protein [Gemmatimonadota bacterium]MYH20304.1 lactonase family protein [Gemmatimonadota bacterium]MYK99614.1 lactonase family protein [Gemmatimonadota bacterium]
MSSDARTIRVFVGTYTQTTSKGIYVYDVDTASGVMEYVSHVGGITNPSFLVLTPDARFLYAVGETGDPHGGVFAYAVDGSGTLKPLNSQSSGGAGPCSIDVHRSGKAVLAANYGGGSVSSFPVNDDGSLGEAASVIQHTGSSVDQSRQQEPHAHMIRHDLDYKFVFSPDLGTDKVMIYALDPNTAVLTPHGEALVPPGSGPRHIEFHPNRKFAYVINEMGNTITAFAYDGSAGTLTALETVTTLPDGYDEVSHTADIHITDDGRYLYGSNRGHDSLAMYAVDGDSGRLSLLGIVPTGGENPRNFGIDPTGSFVLCGNQSSDTVTYHRLDPDTGLLHLSGVVAEIPMAVCLKMIVLD